VEDPQRTAAVRRKIAAGDVQMTAENLQRTVEDPRKTAAVDPRRGS